MSYRELSMKGLPPAKLTIRPGHLGIHDYDVDSFGQDDGASRDPNDSFRLIFEIGAGYFICLFVVGMAQPDGLGRFSTFWLKGIVAVDVEMEEYGEPWSVDGGPFELPVVFSHVTLWRGEQETARFAVKGCSFEARKEQPGGQRLTMRWRLSDDAVLVWTSTLASGWSLLTKEGERVLEAVERVTFVDPKITT